MVAHAEQTLQKTKNVSPATFDFNGHWQNELGSEMKLTVDASNALTGTYISAVSGDGGPTKETPIVGTGTGDLISFTVNWGEAITAWVGHGVFDKDNQPRILTLWHLVVAIADETNPEEQWKTVMTGADEFWR
jgi:Avidin family